ncbi:MAG: Extensin-like protein [Myxococcaceae bacterium]|nr:Extensin-like protein [Myxococcaceae bacterium]
MGSRALHASIALAVLAAACGLATPPERAAPLYTVSATPIAAPLVEVAPAVTSAPAPPPPPVPRSPFAYANIDPEDDLIVAPPDARPTCEEELAAAGVVFKKAALDVHVVTGPRKSKLTCGAPQVVLYQKSPAKIAYEPGVVITCTMALALARFETILQEEAKRSLGKRVVKIHHLGTYNCREMAAYPGWVSEHSYGNAIDLADFVLEDGRTVSVLQRFAPKLEIAKTPESVFLRTSAQRAYREEVFSDVLTPFFDAVHANHFHLDMARYRNDGTQFGGEPAPTP